MTQPARPFTRQSTVLELSSTLPGRAFKALIVRQLPPVATEKERQELEDMTVGLPLETLVELSEGKLTWGIADSVVDLANGKPHRLIPRGVGAKDGGPETVRRFPQAREIGAGFIEIDGEARGGEQRGPGQGQQDAGVDHAEYFVGREMTRMGDHQVLDGLRARRAGL